MTMINSGLKGSNEELTSNVVNHMRVVSETNHVLMYSLINVHSSTAVTQQLLFSYVP